MIIANNLTSFEENFNYTKGDIMPKVMKVTIATLSNGAAIERANLELANVLENIMDPNTSLKFTREINLKIKIKPTDDRTAGGVTIQATSKLAPVAEHQTQLYIGKDVNGEPEASELIQPLLFEDEKITDIKKEGTTDA